MEKSNICNLCDLVSVTDGYAIVSMDQLDLLRRVEKDHRALVIKVERLKKKIRSYDSGASNGHRLDMKGSEARDFLFSILYGTHL